MKLTEEPTEPPPTPDREYLSVKECWLELDKKFGMTDRTFYLKHRKNLKAIIIGGSTRIHRDDLKNYIAKLESQVKQ